MRNAVPEPTLPETPDPEPPIAASPEPAALLVDRFRADLTHQCPLGNDDRLGVAVSGGPDSLALLVLAHAALPGRIEAATVDHGLRPESASEAAMVAEICARLNVPHATLKAIWNSEARTGLQAAARDYRYRELTGWCARRRLVLLATAHHADDQAETLLMRLARGAGVGGLGSIRPVRRLDGGYTTWPSGPGKPVRHPWRIRLVRPLLRFTKAELVAIVEAAGLMPAADPSNDDMRFDRTRARRLLADTDWLDPARLAASASHLADADAALAWAARQEGIRRVTQPDDEIETESGANEWLLDPAGLPDEILRRIVDGLIYMVEDYAVAGYDGPDPSGPDLTRFIARLKNGESATMWHVLARPGPLWRFAITPPRRT